MIRNDDGVCMISMPIEVKESEWLMVIDRDRGLGRLGHGGGGWYSQMGLWYTDSK